MNFQAMEVEEGPAHLSHSPTFSSYSSGSSSLAEIAARVVREIGEEPFADAHNYGWESHGSVYRFRENASNGRARESAVGRSGNCGENGGGDDEFEFAVLCREPDASTSSAHEIFYNGQIKPVYPVFNMDLLLDNDSRVDTGSENSKTKPVTRRLPLRKLMNEEARRTPSISSSEADDLGSIPSDTYCAWSPSTEKTSPGRSKQRNSTGPSNRWKLRDLLYNYSRNKSEGEGTFMMRRTSIKKEDHGNVSKRKEDSSSGVGVTSSTGSNSGFPSFPALNGRNNGRNRAVKESEKRRSYLPYR